MKDRFGREITYLRLSVTELCNLRCRYCMPAEGICKKRHEDMLTEEEMLMAVRAAASLGIRKLRITGGEPLVKKNILSICRNAAKIPGIEELCMTTNGILLPELAIPLREAGVDRINMSLDTLDPQKYSQITRIGSLEDALRGLRAAMDAGFKRIKINAVLIGGFNDDEIQNLAELTLRYPVDVRFIEYMPMPGALEFGPDAYIPCDTVLKRLPRLEPVTDESRVARCYRLPDALGNVGLISAVTNDFCAECNRIRLTADGKIKPCLHSGQEIPIKGLSQEEMTERMKEAILAKPRCHTLLSASAHSHAGRAMNTIGG